jgi:hypothetical protein
MVRGSLGVIPVGRSAPIHNTWLPVDRRIRCLAIREADKWLTNQFREGDLRKGKNDLFSGLDPGWT